MGARWRSERERGALDFVQQVGAEERRTRERRGAAGVEVVTQTTCLVVCRPCRERRRIDWTGSLGAGGLRADVALASKGRGLLGVCVAGSGVVCLMGCRILATLWKIDGGVAVVGGCAAGEERACCSATVRVGREVGHIEGGHAWG